MTILLQENVAAEDNATVYATFTGNGGFDTQYTVVGYLYIMTEMYSIHQIIFITDFCTLSFVCTAADYYIFSNVVFISDYKQRMFTRILKVLWLGSQYGSMMNFVIMPHAGTVQDTGTRHDNVVVTDFHICFDVSKRLHGYVFAEFGGRVYIS